jgi:hypothetical protein
LRGAMGFRFHKRISIAPGIRLNISKNGPSLGLGPAGANINFSRRGKKITLGLPGTGGSFQETRAWGSPEGFSRGLKAFLMIVIAGVSVAILVTIGAIN